MGMAYAKLIEVTLRNLDAAIIKNRSQIIREFEIQREVNIAGLLATGQW